MLEFELAGLGSRAAAAIYDLVIVIGLLLLVSMAVELAGVLPDASRAWATAVLLVISAGTVWGYFFILEGMWGGRTPGKRRLGIRVIMDTGHPITLQAAAIRNLLRLVDFQPAGAPLLALFMVFFHRHNKRLGDLAAGTIVVRERVEQLGMETTADEPRVLDVGQPLLSAGEFRLLSGFLARMDSLDQATRLRFAAKLRRRFSDIAQTDHRRAEDYLLWLHHREESARRGLVPISRGSSERRTSGSGQRFVALRRGAWETFRRRAEQLESKGLRTLTGGDVVEFAESYRELAADLARARTYRVDRRVVEYLERAVAAGHNALYGKSNAERTSVATVLLRRFPAAVIEGRRYVATAMILFVIPAVAGFALMRETPSLAFEFMPPELIARAEAGSEMASLGRGYAETPSPYLPLVASSIVANNVQVAFGAFAFGIAAGLGTVFVLTFNGLFFGSVVGMFANYDLTGWLLTFVAGHGVLELTAIFCAGAGGLLLGRAIIAPGDMVRRDALVVHGRLAIRLVGAAASLLVLAGLIEGFLSASDASPWLKFGVSGASGVLLLLYLMAGRHHSQ
jgi:uncharacterized membrane protein SpoIIM required for sporulation/uncharacterized RDD family membrane protein YckC